MRTLCTALFLLGLVPTLRTQEITVPGASVAPVGAPLLSREEVEQLVGPIALYPDPLLAVILPASTFPSDIVLAARFVESGEDVALADQKPWDPSVRALTRYPDTLKWLDENLEWTTQLGATYLAQPADVMDAIQAMRAKAQAVGNLTDTPQQRVVREETAIRIVPAQPEYIYVPTYEPEVVYYERPIEVPLVYFSPPCEVGWWLNFDFDWHRHRLYCGDWDGGWDYDYGYGGGHRRHDYRGDVVYINNHITNYSEWSGDSRRRFGSERYLAANRVNLNGQRSVARPTRFSARGDRGGEVVRRAIAADDGGLVRSSDLTAARDRNARGQGERRTKGGLALPGRDAPIVAGDHRRGGKDLAVDGKGRGAGNVKRGNRDDVGSVDLADKNRGEKDRAARAQTGPPGLRDDGRGVRDMSRGGNGKEANDAARSRGDAGRPHIQVPKANTGKDHKADRVRDPRSITSAPQGAPKARSAPSVRHSSPQKSLAESKARSSPKSHVASHSNQKSRGPSSVSRGGSTAHAVARSSPPKSQVRAHSAPKKSQVARSSPPKSHARPQNTPKAHVARSSPPKSHARPQNTPKAHVARSSPPKSHARPQKAQTAHVARSSPPKSQARPQKAPKSHTVTASNRSAPKAASSSGSGGGGKKKKG